MTVDEAGSPGRDGSDPAAALARCDLLAGCSREQLPPLAALLTPGTAGAGAVLLRRGDIADHFLFLTGGTASVRFRTGPREKVGRAPRELAGG